MAVFAQSPTPMSHETPPGRDQADARGTEPAVTSTDAIFGRHSAFATMMRTLTGTRDLPQWIKQVEADYLPGLRPFTTSIQRDLAAVTAGLSLPYSSGPVERHVNRIKMIKRQMYGRASFDLLRRRVLAPI